MDFEALRETIEEGWENFLDIAAFTAVGHLSGRTVNWYNKWTSKPFIFGKAEMIDLKGSTLCCALFVTIDRLAYAIFVSLIGDEKAEKPTYSAIRIALSMAAAINAVNILSPLGKFSRIEFKVASTVILTTVVFYSQILLMLEIFNRRP